MSVNNHVNLIGRLTRDPEIKEKVARYNLAVDRNYKKEGQPDADFFQCVVFGKGIEFVQKYLHKGMKIAVEGYLQTGSYTKEDGSKFYTFDVVATSHEFCESRKTTSEGSTHSSIDDLASFPNVNFVDETDDSGDLPF